ncbi:uncharacterized protein LOC126824463 [Patella vulgata]|uniref:uncharacterized protein LOC126824463 n=1 Tax=Patella vulgata TaxID=6465 RepID=UPI00217F2F43|nr:uncharacterized protein LOC126824463 [Patella vulgata]
MAPERRTSQESGDQRTEQTRSSTENGENITQKPVSIDGQKDKKCFIKIVLPSQDDEFHSNTEGGSTKIGKVNTSISRNSETSEHSPQILADKNTQFGYEHDRMTCNSSDTGGDSVRDDVFDDNKIDHHHDLETTILNLYASKIGKQPLEEKEDNSLSVGSLKDACRINNKPKLVKRTEKQKHGTAIDRVRASNLSGSFVDIGGWQNELQKSPRFDPLLQKRTKTFPSLGKKYKPGIGELPFRFEHHEDLNRYIRDYRYTHTLGGVGRKQYLDGALQNNIYPNSLTGGQWSLRSPNFRIKTTDPTSRTFLPQTQRSIGNLHPGCILCEKEKFRLRNSFPKRVYLSWNQYMALCKSNTALMSQATNYSIDTTSSQATPRAVTSYSPTRPEFLMNQREKSYDIGCKYGKESNGAKTGSNERKKIDPSSLAMDKTLLVYRLRGKMKNSVNGGKHDSNETSNFDTNNSLTLKNTPNPL